MSDEKRSQDPKEKAKELLKGITKEDIAKVLKIGDSPHHELEMSDEKRDELADIDMKNYVEAETDAFPRLNPEGHRNTGYIRRFGFKAGYDSRNDEVAELKEKLRIAREALEDAKDGLECASDDLFYCFENGCVPDKMEVRSAKAYMEDAREALREIGEVG
jgi:hypothetical protein